MRRNQPDTAVGVPGGEPSEAEAENRLLRSRLAQLTEEVSRNEALLRMQCCTESRAGYWSGPSTRSRDCSRWSMRWRDCGEAGESNRAR